jgi:hypothetical protein
MRASLLFVVACGSSPMPGIDHDAPLAPDASPVETSPLRVTSLGVQGFALAYGDDVVLTAPMFTRQSAFLVGINAPIETDTAAVDSGLASISLDKVRAIVSGHAHYDHLLDVPYIITKTPNANVYANRTAKHIFAALAPDRPSCTEPAPMTIARDRIVAMDEPNASHVDWTNCPSQKPGGAPLEGTWAIAPGGRVRVKAFCSMHPDQIGPIHFGAGAIDNDLCELPSAAAEWLEGVTLAFVIDFLDEHGAPTYRIFYQDAPTDAPVGHVPASILAEHQVDLALLCVGSYDAVEDHPGAIVRDLTPRYAVSGHWEDFFQDASEPPQPIPLLDLETYMTAADAALTGAPDGAFLVDGTPSTTRHVLAQPGMQLTIPAH